MKLSIRISSPTTLWGGKEESHDVERGRENLPRLSRLRGRSLEQRISQQSFIFPRRRLESSPKGLIYIGGKDENLRSVKTRGIKRGRGIYGERRRVGD